MTIPANNRPQVAALIGAAASKKFPVLVAHKRMIVLAAKLASVGAITASGANYSTLKLQKAAAGVTPADVTGATAVDTQAGVAAYGQVALTVPSAGIELAAGECLYLDHALTGTLTLDAWLHLDVQIAAS